MRKSPWILLALLAGNARAQELADEPPPPHPIWEELRRLQTRVGELEAQQSQSARSQPVDLTDDELPSIDAAHSDHVLARPWFDNVDLSGYGAFTYLDTGGTGTTPDGAFLVKEASLFLDAQVWDRGFLFTELWMTRYLFGDRFTIGELYFQLTGVFAEESEPGLGFKAGRFEIPFGEEYLRWDATQTPFITFSAADPYGMDEGVEAYGALGPVSWITAVSNGSTGSGDDGPAKQVAAKLYGDPFSDLYLSGSVLKTGNTAESALRFGGTAITPVGSDGASTAGASPSEEVDTWMWEADASIAAKRRFGVVLQFGQAYIDDDVNAFDRDLTWFQIQPGFRLRDDLELVLRYSEVGTYDDDEGYQFEGKIVTDGEAFGYDTSVLRRLSGGLRWFANPHVAVKAEVGHDWVELIDASAFDEENDERLFFGFELVASF